MSHLIHDANNKNLGSPGSSVVLETEARAGSQGPAGQGREGGRAGGCMVGVQPRGEGPWAPGLSAWKTQGATWACLESWLEGWNLGQHQVRPKHRRIFLAKPWTQPLRQGLSSLLGWPAQTASQERGGSHGRCIPRASPRGEQVGCSPNSPTTLAIGRGPLLGTDLPAQRRTGPGRRAPLVSVWP